VARKVTDRSVTTDLAHGLATQRLFSSTVAAVGCELRDGALHPPEGPGLGIEIDEEALAAHRLDRQVA
jgi:L-alanine-DL-glutamate epimerase-like enolase superfamily enzyme